MGDCSDADSNGSVVTQVLKDTGFETRISANHKK